MLLLSLQCLDAVLVMCWGWHVPPPECAIADGKALVPAKVAMAARRYGYNWKLLVLLAPSSCRRLRMGGAVMILGCLLGLCDKVRKETFWVGGRGAVPLPMHRQELLGRSSSQRVYLTSDRLVVRGWIWEGTAAIRYCCNGLTC